MSPRLPPVPAHGLTFQDRGRVQSPAKYLQLASFAVSRADADGRSAMYDVVERKALDAVIVAPYWLHEGAAWVRLRTVVRPPMELRGPAPEGVAQPPAALWEVPAGLIEPGEAPAEAAARELYEELAVRPLELTPLGPPLCPCAAVIGEIHVYYAAKLHAPNGDFPIPEGDGSLYEEDPAFASVTLDDALAACRTGEIWDTKTEVALRRLQELLTAR